MACHRRGKYESAVADFRKALVLDPHDKNIQSLLKLSAAKESEVSTFYSHQRTRLECFLVVPHHGRQALLPWDEIGFWKLNFNNIFNALWNWIKVEGKANEPSRGIREKKPGRVLIEEIDTIQVGRLSWVVSCSASDMYCMVSCIETVVCGGSDPTTKYNHNSTSWTSIFYRIS